MGRVYDALKRAAESGDSTEKRNGNAPSADARAEKGIAPAGSNGHNRAGGSPVEKGTTASGDARTVEVKSVAVADREADAPELFLRPSRHFKSPETAQR